MRKPLPKNIRVKNWATLIGLVALVVAFYFMAMIRIQESGWAAY